MRPEAFKIQRRVFYAENTDFLIQINDVLTSGIGFQLHLADGAHLLDNFGDAATGGFDPVDVSGQFFRDFFFEFHDLDAAQQGHQRLIQLVGRGAGHLQQNLESFFFNDRFLLVQYFMVGFL